MKKFFFLQMKIFVEFELTTLRKEISLKTEEQTHGGS